MLKNIIKDFDAQYYLTTYHDLRQFNIKTEQDALNHFIKYGFKEGRRYKREANPIIKNDTIIHNSYNNSNNYYGLTSYFNFKYNKISDKNIHSSILNSLLDTLYIINNDEGILFDIHIENTFILHKKEYIYSDNWVGILHNPPNIYDLYNTESIFNNIYFQDSLKNCKGLFTLSQYHKKYVEEYVYKLQLKIDVYNLYFPLIDIKYNINLKEHDTQNSIFSPDIFNQNKKVIQIEWWNCKQTTIYDIDYQHTKCIIVNKKTSEIQKSYLDIEQQKYIQNKQNNQDNQNNQNNDSISKIQIIESDDDDYHTFLLDSIVFVDIYDSSYHVIILKCIQYNTPLLINNVGGVHEYLGKEYPFYYNSIEEATKKINNSELIYNTHVYLKNLVKDTYYIDNFIHDIIYSEIHININKTIYTTIDNYVDKVDNLSIIYKDLELNIDWYFYIHYNNLLHENICIFNKNLIYKITDESQFIFIINTIYREFLFKIFDIQSIYDNRSIENKWFLEIIKNKSYNSIDIIKHIKTTREFIIKNNSFSLYKSINKYHHENEYDNDYHNKNDNNHEVKDINEIITIICLFRDNENILDGFLKQFINLEIYYPHFTFEYIFYENDSIDKTYILLQEFIKNRKGYVLTEKMDTEKYGDTRELKRVKNLTYYRNQTIKNKNNFESTWTICVDTDIYFENNIIDKFLEIHTNTKYNKNISMLLPNSIDINIECNNKNYHKCNLYHYYDTWAFIDRNNNLCTENEKDNKKQTRCNPFTYNKNDMDYWEKNEPVKVNSAFGGLCFIKTSILKKNDIFWSYFNYKYNNIGGCEHWLFCKRLRKYGNIYICPNIICLHDRKNRESNRKSIFKKMNALHYSLNTLHIHHTNINENIYYETITHNNRKNIFLYDCEKNTNIDSSVDNIDCSNIEINNIDSIIHNIDSSNIDTIYNIDTIEYNDTNNKIIYNYINDINDNKDDNYDDIKINIAYESINDKDTILYNFINNNNDIEDIDLNDIDLNNIDININDINMNYDIDDDLDNGIDYDIDTYNIKEIDIIDDDINTLINDNKLDFDMKINYFDDTYYNDKTNEINITSILQNKNIYNNYNNEYLNNSDNESDSANSIDIIENDDNKLKYNTTICIIQNEMNQYNSYNKIYDYFYKNEKFHIMKNKIIDIIRDIQYDKQYLIFGNPIEYSEIIKLNNIYTYIYCTLETDQIPDSWFYILNKVEKIFVPSNYIKNIFIKNKVAKNIEVVDLGYTRFKRMVSLNDYILDDYRIGIICVPYKIKNIDKLIHACDSIKNIHKINIKLYIHIPYFLYDNMRIDLLNILYEIDNKDIIHISYGYYDYNQMSEWFSILHTYINVSSSEGWSYTPRESLYLEIPTIITNIPVHHELCNSGFYTIINIKDNLCIPAFLESIHENCGTCYDIHKQDIVNGILYVYSNYNLCSIKSRKGSLWIKNLWKNQDIPNTIYKKIFE